MFARVVIGQAPAEKADAVSRIMNDIALARARTSPGFQDGVWLFDRQSGKILAVTVWDTRESLEAAFPASGLLTEVSTALQALGASGQPTIEVYEVLAKA